MRVGSPKLDNYHSLNGQKSRSRAAKSFRLDDVPDAIRRRVWLDTDRTYKLAARRLIEIKSDQQVKVKDADGSADFSIEPPAVTRSRPRPSETSMSEWAERARKWSAAVADYPDVLYSSVSLSVERISKYMVSTEGTRLLHGRNFVNLSIVARGKAADGMDLVAHAGFPGGRPGALAPSRRRSRPRPIAWDTISRTCCRRRRSSRSWVPAILSGRAAAVFFHEIFGHRIEGHRQKDEAEGQTFTKAVGTPVLPDFLSVVFDPTRKTLDGDRSQRLSTPTMTKA